MKPLAPRFLAVIAACVVAFACGSVPTLADGIAFISPVVRPSLAILVNDTLRDSLGRVAPLRVHQFNDNEDTIPGIPPSFLVVTVPAGLKIDANGIVTTVMDSLQRVQVVGRVGDRLQTEAVNLEVVAQPDLIAATGTIEPLAPITTSAPVSASSPLQVTVTGNRKGTRVPVGGIIVRYRIDSTFPARTINDTLFAFTEGLRGNLTNAVDTTDAGSASRAFIATDLTGIDTVYVSARANNLKGVPITPVRFKVPVKKGS